MNIIWTSHIEHVGTAYASDFEWRVGMWPEFVIVNLDVGKQAVAVRLNRGKSLKLGPSDNYELMGFEYVSNDGNITLTVHND